MLGVGGRTLLKSRDARAAITAARDVGRTPAEWPAMGQRPLGQTGWNASPLVFGCGAALSRQRRDDLLEAAFDAGVNVFDVGFRGYYADAEKHLAPFLKRHRDDVFLISKARPLDLQPDETLTPDQHRLAAKTWTAQIEASLIELDVEQIDAYYMMATNNVSLVNSEEVRAAFETAKAAGKIRFRGISTHQNAERVLEALAGAGFDLAMIAITPSGWYDWADKAILQGSKPMATLQPALERARAAGVGLIGMKAGRYLAGRKFIGWGKANAFDEHYDARFLNSGLTAFQRSYAYVLAHGLDAVNADMQSLAHLEENVAATVASAHYFTSGPEPTRP